MKKILCNICIVKREIARIFLPYCKKNADTRFSKIILSMWKNSNEKLFAFTFTPMFPLKQTNDIQEIFLNNISGFGEAVHPSVIYFPNGFGTEKYRFVMAITPYPLSNDRYENPEFLISNDAIHWNLPRNGKSPVVEKPETWFDYNSDPLLFYDNQKLCMLYRKISLIPEGNKIELFIIRSGDGVKWSRPELIHRTMCPGNIKPELLMSPCIIKNDGKYCIWYVSRAEDRLKIMTLTTDNLHNWGHAQKVNIDLPDNSEPWHIDVVQHDGILFMSVLNYENGNNKTIFIAVSSDNGANWILTDTRIYAAPYDRLYKPCLVFTETKALLFFSIAENKHWHPVFKDCKI